MRHCKELGRIKKGHGEREKGHREYKVHREGLSGQRKRSPAARWTPESDTNT